MEEKKDKLQAAEILEEDLEKVSGGTGEPEPEEEMEEQLILARYRSRDSAP